VKKSLSTLEKWPSGWKPVIGAKCTLIPSALRVYFNWGHVGIYSM
jgi:hypothetical protein